MKCTQCGRPASKYQIAAGGKTREAVLCPACYAALTAREGRRCPACGMTLEEYRRTGLVGCAAVNDGAGGMLIFGGVNAEIFREALENPPPDYLRRAPAWYRFNADVLRLSFGADGKAKWEKLGNVPATARAGASAAVVGARRGPAGTELDVVFVCGELKPGFRSPECVRIRIRTK